MKIFIDISEKGFVQGWGSSSITANDIEVDIENDHPFFTDNIFTYKYVDGQLVKSDEIALQQAKEEKDDELNKACQQAILGGFNYIIDGVVYHFSFDTEAQLNFQGAERLFSQGLVDEVMWTVKKDGEYIRIPINRSIMDELALAILKHKNDNISKYRDILMPMVKSAKTIEEVESIHWGMDLSQI